MHLLSVVQLSDQEVSDLCIYPLALCVTTLTTSLCSALFFFFFFFLFFFFLHLPRACPAVSFPCLPVSGCAVTAIKRLPFMRSRSKDKDKAKAIYRRSMCKTSVSRHASPPLSPLPLIVSVGETKEEQSLISGWLQCGGLTVTE